MPKILHSRTLIKVDCITLLAGSGYNAGDCLFRISNTTRVAHFGYINCHVIDFTCVIFCRRPLSRGEILASVFINPSVPQSRLGSRMSILNQNYLKDSCRVSIICSKFSPLLSVPSTTSSASKPRPPHHPPKSTTSSKTKAQPPSSSYPKAGRYLTH